MGTLDKTWKTYPEYSDLDACTKGYDVIYRHVTVVMLHHAGTDKVAPVGTDSARAKDNMKVAFEWLQHKISENAKYNANLGR